MWHKLAVQLKLVLTYKNESNINSTIEIDDNNYIFHYANKGTNLRNLIDVSTAEVDLKRFYYQSTNYCWYW